MTRCRGWSWSTGHVRGRWVPEAPVPDHDGLAVETVLDPLAQARGGERVPLVAGRLRNGLRLLRHGADARGGATWRPGRSSINSSRRGDRACAGAAGHRGGVHGDGRAVPDLRPRAGGGRTCCHAHTAAQIAAKAITISTVGSSPRSTDTPPRGTSTGCRSAWGPRPTKSGRNWCPSRPDGRSPR